MTPRRAASLALAVVVLAAGATPARAQGTPAPRPARTAPAWEVSVTGTWARGAAIGGIDAAETQPNGAPFSLFTAESRLDNLPGVGLTITRHVAGAWSVEADGLFGKPTYRTSVASDFENAALTEATNVATEFGVAGAVVVTFARGAHLQPFVRGGGGWRRELSADQTLSADGRLVIAGGGVKYWWGAAPATSRAGLRADVGVVGRSGGLALGDTIRWAPAVAAGLSFRF